MSKDDSEGGMWMPLWLEPVLWGVGVSIILLWGVTCLMLLNSPAPQTKKVQVQVDCLISPDMVKYLEHEGHGKVFGEEDME